MDLYLRLTTGAMGSQSTFTEPTTPPGTGTMATVDEIMAAAPAVDDTDGSQPDEVLAGRTYWSLRSGGAWGTQTGTMPNIGREDIMPGASIQAISQGYHDGTGEVAGDGDLIPGNIRSGVNLFGQDGHPHVVNTGSGNATAADVCIGSQAWVAGNLIVGTRDCNPSCAGLPRFATCVFCCSHQFWTGTQCQDLYVDGARCSDNRECQTFCNFGTNPNVCGSVSR
jgi:hypothetical protein